MYGKFNERQLMGNCENCYYATDRSIKETWMERGKYYDCHRYSTTIEKERGDYCGEFAYREENNWVRR